MTIFELYSKLERFYQPDLRCEWDHDGLQICMHPNANVKGICIALDPTEDVVEEAKKNGCNVILTHHPILFKPLEALDNTTSRNRAIIELLGSDMASMSFHSRCDAAPAGVSFALAKMLELEDIEVPKENPIIRVGMLKHSMPCDAFAQHVKKCLKAPFVQYTNAPSTVRRVACVGGEGKDFIELAKKLDCDTLVTGAVGHHTLIDENPELSIFEAGHYYTEAPILDVFEKNLMSLGVPQKMIYIVKEPPYKTI